MTNKEIENIVSEFRRELTLCIKGDESLGGKTICVSKCGQVMANELPQLPNGNIRTFRMEVKYLVRQDTKMQNKEKFEL